MGTPPSPPSGGGGSSWTLSPEQRRILAETPGRTVGCTVVLEGAVEVATLERAFATVVANHEVLRTRVVLRPGMREPTQEVAPSYLVPWLRLAAPAPGSPPPPEAADGLVVRIATTPGAAWLRIDAPALQIDHLALRILVEEIARAYGGHPTEDDAAITQHGDYAEWIRELAEGPDGLEGRRFWAGVTAALRGAPARPAGARRAQAEVTLGVDAGPRLEATADRLGLTSEALLLAGWAIVAARSGGSASVGLGVEIDGRRLDDLRGALGPYAQRVPVAIELGPGATFRALAHAIGERLEEARSWAPHLLGDAGAPAWGFACEAPVAAPIEARGVRFAIRDEVRPTAPLVMLTCLRDGTHFAARVSVQGADACDEEARVLAARLVAILTAALDRPEAAWDTLPTLGDGERARILAFARPAARPMSEPTVLDAIARWAAEVPDRDAVRFDGARLTYRELDERAAGLAARLVAAGVGPEARVPMILQRSLDLPVAILGILRAGAAYVPLDPRYPDGRIAQILEEAGARVAVVDATTASVMRGLGMPVIEVEPPTDAPAPGRPPAPPELDPRGLAYVIYTSGSTGRPKGVEVTHGNLLASTDARRRLWPEGGDTTILVYSFGFDSSIAPIFQTLCGGGTLLVAGAAEAADPAAIARLARREDATLIFCNPNLWRSVLDELEREPAPTLGCAVVAGEASTPALVRRHFEVLPGARLINEYGPTEATVWCTAHACAPEDAQLARVPIGTPIDHAEVFLLSPALDLVPIGVEGEVHVGGAGLARGYGGAAQTAERFVPHPFARAGERIYRTGDRARLGFDGRLDFLGRVDEQVKIRGYRVEPREIERVVGTLTAVGEVVVIARPDEAGLRLVCYLTSTAPTPPTEAEVRAHVARYLPDFMVPARCVRLERLPRTSHGKIDRAALPEPGDERGGAVGRAPETPTERTLADAWAKVLGRSSIGLDDNFFELGGDSIRAIQLRSRVVAQGLTFRLDAFLATPTLAGLASLVRVSAERDAPATAPFALLDEAERAGLAADVEDAFPVTMLQAGMLFHSELSGHSGLYQDLTSVHLRARLDLDVLRGVLDAAIARHPVLRSSIAPARVGGRLLQRIHRAASVGLEVQDLRGDDPADVAARLEEFLERERRTPVELARPPALRVTIHRRSADAFQITWLVHHAFLDGWSNASLAAEVLGAYAAGLEGHAVDVEAPRAHVRDYVALERASLASAEDRAFWVEGLRDAEGTLLARRRGPHRAHALTRSAVRPTAFTLPRELARGVAELAAREGVPARTVLLAAHLRVLALLTGARDLISGVVTNGRSDEDGDRVLGLFLNVIPLRIALAPGSWRELVRQVAAAEAAWRPFRRYPMAQIQRDLGGRPLFDAAFNYTHFHVLDRATSVPGLEVVGAVFRDEHNFALSAAFGQDPTDPGRIALTLYCDRRWFDDDEVARLHGWYELALRALTSTPDARHDDSAWTTPEDARTIAATNETARALPRGTLHGLVLAQARRDPDALAIVAGERRVSYATLAAAAIRVAEDLRRRGVAPEEPVGVLLERSPESVAAALGVLAAGATYLPLDPEAPPGRHRLLLAAAGARLVVCEPKLRGHLDPSSEAIVLEPPASVPVLDEPEPEPGAGAVAVAMAGTREDAGAGAAPLARLAYVLYTSGSTGQPKGVAVSHGAITNHLAWRQAAFPLAPGARMLHKAPAVFDIGVWELFAPLIAGATVVLARPGGHRDPAYLADLIVRESIQIAHFHPTLLARWLDEPASARATELRHVFVGGESLPAESARRLARLLPTQLVHQYGPTEATVDATCWVVPDGADDPLPIGTPIANTIAHVLDDDLRSLPPGAPGELYLGGLGLARGYLGAPDRTAERFVPDPTPGAPPGARAYRTGDRVLRDATGALVFLGRVDHQVKVRGFRVELGEVEAHLLAQPDVREAAVVAVEGRTGVLELHAFVVGPVAGVIPALRDRLRASIPEYLVPAHLDALPELPATPGGKPDRAALRELAHRQATPRATSRPPTTDLERQVARCLAAVLQREEVGVDDDFFALGGDSLQATRAAAELTSLLGVEIPVADFFLTPTVAGVVRLVSPPATEELEAARLLEQIDELAPEDVDRLLRERLATRT